MAMESINPATGERLLSYTPWKEAQLDQALTLTARATPGWQATPFAERAAAQKCRHRAARQRRALCEVDYSRNGQAPQGGARRD